MRSWRSPVAVSLPRAPRARFSRCVPEHALAARQTSSCGALSAATKLKVISPSEEIDVSIANFPDWRGAKIAHLGQTILAVDSEIIETWKWMGSPVWEHNGILCVAGIYTGKAKLTFHDGAALADPDGRV
jgi:hypothetical protein